VLLSLRRVAKIRVIVGLLEQVHIVGRVILTQTTLQILWIPLLVVRFVELSSALLEELITATEQNHRVWVDVLLEFGRVLFLLLFSLVRITRFGRNLVAFLVKYFLLGLRRIRSDNEDLERRLEADRVAIQDVASVLAIILAQAPSEGLTEHLAWNLLLFWIFFVVLVDLRLEIKFFELIVRVGLISISLGKFLLV